MKRRILSSMLILTIAATVMPTITFADDAYTGSNAGIMLLAKNGAFNCPNGCTVTTTDGTTFTHSDPNCNYEYYFEQGYIDKSTTPPSQDMYVVTCVDCGGTSLAHTDTCHFNCPTDDCIVTYDGTTYSHSKASCPYSDKDLYCSECGYLEYRAEDDDFFHDENCSLGNKDQVKDDTENVTTPGAVDSEYNVNGVTYFGVDSNNFDNSTKLFIQDMLSAKNKKLGGKSTAALWQYLSYCIQDDKGRGTSTGKFKKQFDNVIPNGLAYNTNSTGAYSANKKSGDNKYNVRSSGLVYAKSMAAAASAMEEQVYQGYDGAGGKRGRGSSVAKNDTLWNDTDADDVFWMVTGAYKTSGTNKKGHYQALGVLFSDFTITTILPDDKGNFYQTTSSESAPGSKTYASNVKNMTDIPVSAQQEISNTTSTTATSAINGSKSYGFEESLEIGYEHGLLGGKAHANLTFTASQTIESGWSEEKSKSDEQTTTYNVGVELPAYTNVMMKQSESEATTTTKYNCPVALNFNVTIVEYTLDPSSNDAGCKTQVLATFGANARKNLNRRGVVESVLTDPDGIGWLNLYNNHNGLKNIVEEQLASTAPMASAGATFTVIDKVVASEISGLAPIYPLYNIKTTNDIMEYNFSFGESMYVDNIEINGYNIKNAMYYGFNPNKGHWILVDKDDNILTDSPVAKLVTNPVTGYTKLVAGNEEGTVYLRYVIDEDVYSTAEEPTVYAKNRNLDSTAVIEINISEKPFNDGKVIVNGELTGIANDPEKAIEGTEGLSTVIEDATGKNISRPIVWEAKEMPSDGIKVENNRISFVKEGTFHIRAKTGNVYSEWYEVKALPARKLNTIDIPKEVSIDYKNEQTVNLAALQINYKDQYGDDWTNIPTLTWTCAEEGATVENDVLTVPSAGTYTVTVTGDGVTSNTMTITVTDSTIRVTAFKPETTALAYSGGSVEFVLTGTNLPNGITIKANDDIKAETTGTDKEQKAILNFPANTNTESIITYNIVNSLDADKTVIVTVAKKPSGGSTSGDGGGGGGGSSKKFDIAIAETLNGKIKIDKDGAYQGNVVTITTEPDKGYELKAIKVTDKDGKELKITEINKEKYSFAMPDGKVDIKAEFIKQQENAEIPKEITAEEGKKTIIKMQIGNKRMFTDSEAFDYDVAPVIVNSRTLVPIRFITESLGGKVQWNEETKEVTLTTETKEIKMSIGKTLEKYGVAPVIINERTFVPIRFVADELGAEVQWNDETKTVTIIKTIPNK